MTLRLFPRRLFFLSVLFLLALIPYPLSLIPSSRAQDNPDDRLDEINRQIEEYEKKLAELVGQKKTLADAVSYLNTQIALTQSRIVQTETTLSILARDISDLTVRIDRLDESLDDLTNVLVERIRTSYKQERTQPLYLVLTSTEFTDFINQLKYIRSAQEHDRSLLLAMERTRSTYDAQRDILQQKHEEEDALRRTLQSQKQSLAVQQQDKQRLLEVTKNDEKRYQELLSKARAELEAIQSIIAGKGEETKVGDVLEGNKIASIIPTNSACSTGAHLHFEVAKNKTHENPQNYLRNANLSYDYDTSTVPETVSPSGSWRWPLDEPITITQIYGATFWTKFLHYDFHTGIDMKKGGDTGAPVFAVSNGTLYRGSVACGGGTLRYVRVDHGDNLSTYYLHVNYI